MSQNKTKIQGLEEASYNNGNRGDAGLYSRSGRSARGTVVSGMTPDASAAGGEDTTTTPHQPTFGNFPTGKPVIGFFYSVSRTAAGEYWPLHIGQNTIGQSADCDIVLPEGTVSSEHAVLVVRKLKKPEKVIASISDARSTNGTMLNGESLGFSAVECKNGDKLLFGDNYELLLILLDATALGLGVSKNFIHISSEEEESAPAFQFDPGRTRDIPEYDPFAGGAYSPAGGTVGIDGSTPSKGGTIAM